MLTFNIKKYFLKQLKITFLFLVTYLLRTKDPWNPTTSSVFFWQRWRQPLSWVACWPVRPLLIKWFATIYTSMLFADVFWESSLQKGP